MSVRCFALLLLFTAMGAQAAAPRTFNEAKKVAWKLYAPQSTEFYCGCKYTGNKVDLAACGYVPRKVPSVPPASSGNTLFRRGRSAINASAGNRADAKLHALRSGLSKGRGRFAQPGAEHR